MWNFLFLIFRLLQATPVAHLAEPWKFIYKSHLNLTSLFLFKAVQGGEMPQNVYFLDCTRFSTGFCIFVRSFDNFCKYFVSKFFRLKVLPVLVCKFFHICTAEPGGAFLSDLYRISCQDTKKIETKVFCSLMLHRYSGQAPTWWNNLILVNYVSQHDIISLETSSEEF